MLSERSALAIRPRAIVSNRLPIYFLLLTFLSVWTFQGQEQSQPDPDLNRFWENEQFVDKFMGTYGFNTDVEPKFKTPEETEYYRGLAEVIRENPEEAVKSLAKKINNQSSAILNFVLGTLYLQTGRLTNAIQQFEVAMSKFPDYRRAHKNLALALIQEGRYEDAVEPLSKTMELGGADSNVFGMLGFCYFNQERYLSAASAYRNAVLYAPANPEWKLGLIKCSIAQGDYRSATLLLDELLSDNPDNSRLWSLQANVYMQMEKPGKASVNLEILRRMGQATAQDLMLLGDIYMFENFRSLALSAYLAGLDAGGVDQLQRALRAMDILASQGAWEEAAALMSKARETGGAEMSQEDSLKLLKIESRMAMAREQPEKAIQILEQIIEQDPMDGEALILAGDYYSDKGEREKAEFRYESASKIQGFEAAAFVKQAQLLVKHQKYREAVELLRKAQKIEPKENIQQFLEAVESIAGRA